MESNKPRGGYKGNNQNRGGGEKVDIIVKVSKCVSYQLRHGAAKEGLNMDKEGYVYIDELLEVRDMKRDMVTKDLLLHIIGSNDKQRFALSADKQKIRASQGHTITTIDDESIYETIKDPNEIPFIVHGTDKKAWGFIMTQGLNRMARTHIHFAIGLPGENQVISGMRVSCDVIVQVDVEKAMKAGIVFQKSANNVILSRGINDSGIIPPDFFKKVTCRYNNTSVEQGSGYDYALVLDFEANCVNKGSLKCQEIIEFPVVPVNLKTKEIMIDKIFHYYIKPHVVPELTVFCTELTGITQNMVGNAISLEKGLVAFEKWKKIHGFDKSNSIFVTCGDWDLKTCLKNEAVYKNITYDSHQKEWANLKLLFQSCSGKKTGSMTGMLKYFDLELEGKHHSGIDDSKNIARILVEMQKKGLTLTSMFVKVLP